MTKHDETTLVHRASGEIEAQQIKNFLEAHGIPSYFLGESLRKTHGLTLDGLGRVEIHVPEELAAKARELLAEVAAGAFELGEEDVIDDEIGDDPSDSSA